MKIIHGHFNDLPREVSVYRLAAVAVIVDYYKCHDVVSFFPEMWHPGQVVPFEFNDDFLPRLLIACVFAKKDELRQMTKGMLQFNDDL